MIKNKFSIDDYFAEARHKTDERPLMTIEGVETVVTGARREHRSIQRKAEAKKTSWTALAGGMSLAAAATAGLILTTKALEKNAAPVHDQVEVITSSPMNEWASTMDMRVPAEEKTLQTNQPDTKDEQKASHFTVTPDNAAPEAVGGTALMTLSQESLGKLGVTISGSRAVYQGSRAASLGELAEYYHASSDQIKEMIQKDSTLLTRHRVPTKIAIRTNGIGSVPIDTQADTILSVPTPRIVSTYVHGRLMVSYWDRQDQEAVESMYRNNLTIDRVGPDSTVNLLIPIHFKLEDKKSAHFKEADVVLWYAASPDVVSALPEPYRSQLQQELTAQKQEERTPEAITGERFIENWRTSSGAIIASSLYPNPASGTKATLRYTLQEERTVTISLHDIFGRRIVELRSEHVNSGDQEATLPIQNMESGMYLVVVTTDKNEQAVQRLLIQR